MGLGLHRDVRDLRGRGVGGTRRQRRLPRHRVLRDRVLVKLTDDLVFHQTAIQGLRQILAEYKSKSPKIDVPTFKDLTGISRKYAIPLLEYLDRERVTRRVGDERVIL